MARIERDRKVTSPSLPRAYPFVPRRGAGSIVEDVDGNIFLDLNAGIAVTSTGHCHPTVVEAIQRQAPSCCTTRRRTSTCRSTPTSASGSTRWRRSAGRQARSFLTNSGTEAVEAAIKLARYATGRQYLIGFYQSFHGRSMGSRDAHRVEGEVPHALRADAAERLPLLLRGLRLPRGGAVQADRLARPRSPRSSSSPGSARAGTCSRPRAGSGTCASSATSHGILLVCDEVQSGMGRSGTMWAIEQEGVDARHRHVGQGHRERPAARRDDRPRGPDGLGARRARLDLRWLAAVVRGGARDVRRDRAARDCSANAQRGRRGAAGGAPRHREPPPARSPRCAAGRCGSGCRSPITTRRPTVEQARSARAC